MSFILSIPAIVYGRCSLENALNILEELLVAIKQLNLANKNSLIWPTVTASIGVATSFPNEHTDQNDIVKAADNQLYLAKENGRNQVSFKGN